MAAAVQEVPIPHVANFAMECQPPAQQVTITLGFDSPAEAVRAFETFQYLYLTGLLVLRLSPSTVH